MEKNVKKLEQQKKEKAHTDAILASIALASIREERKRVRGTQDEREPDTEDEVLPKAKKPKDVKQASSDDHSQSMVAKVISFINKIPVVDQTRKAVSANVDLISMLAGNTSGSLEKQMAFVKNLVKAKDPAEDINSTLVQFCQMSLKLDRTYLVTVDGIKFLQKVGIPADKKGINEVMRIQTESPGFPVFCYLQELKLEVTETVLGAYKTWLKETLGVKSYKAALAKAGLY